ncbi:MAG: NADH-quinone oxidoreductase subunit A, partial [Pirellulales bacterium]
MTPVSIVAYLALFAGLGFAFLFVNLLVGKLVRPKDPHAEKLEVYECGEPTIGSSFVQFDLRFYVVALLFIIFDVEVAFFFPWATVYGKSTHLMDKNFAEVAQQRAESSLSESSLSKPESQWSDAERQAVSDRASAPVLYKFAELGVSNPTMGTVLAKPSPVFTDNAREIRSVAGQVARMSLLDIGVFFAVLMVGFFYVWRRGDLDWVRAVGRERASQID